MRTFISLLMFSPLMTSMAYAQNVSIARAAELGCHRIERLRDLGRISEDYVTKAYAVKIEPANSGNAKFKWTGFQSPGADGKANQIVLMLDTDGKAIGTPTEIQGSAPIAPAWPVKDPISLWEAAVHYILDNASSKPELAPFNDGLTEGVIGQIQSNGELVARVEFKSSETASVFEVLLKMDGTLVSTKVK